VLLVETQQFSLDRVLRADEHESSPTPQVRTSRVFWQAPSGRTWTLFLAAS
jgi:hypothetical protein